MTAQDHSDIASMSFEQALSELEQIVKRLEQGQGALEDSIADYTRGTALKQHCQKKLDEAKLRVEQIVQAEDGSLSTKPFAAGE